MTQSPRRAPARSGARARTLARPAIDLRWVALAAAALAGAYGVVAGPLASTPPAFTSGR